MDNTVTRTLDCQAQGTCYASQCAACVSTVQVGTQELQLDGSPANGRLCFMAPSSDVTLDQNLAPFAIHSYLVVPRYTNVDIRIIVDVDLKSMSKASPLQVLVSDNSNITFINSYLSFFVPPFVTLSVSERRTIFISSDNFDFDLKHFYVIVHSTSNATIAYRISFFQPFVSIDLFVFFAVFFSSFFLFLAVVAIGLKVKSTMDDHVTQNNMARQIEVCCYFGCDLPIQAMASRPLAIISILTGPPLVGSQAAALVAAVESGQLPLKAACIQPLRSSAAVMSFVVELPLRHKCRNVCIGSALARRQHSDPPQRRPRQNVFVSSSV